MGRDVNVCPKCGSVCLGWKPRVGKGNAVANVYVCKECGYEGICPIIDETELESFQEELRQEESR